MRSFKPQVRTKNSSSSPLRSRNGGIGDFAMRSIVRLGSLTTTEEAFRRAPAGAQIIEVNSVASINNSRNKLLMKDCFAVAGVPQSDWFDSVGRTEDGVTFIDRVNSNTGITRQDDIRYPILMKKINGFKGHGMVKIDSVDELNAWMDDSRNLIGFGSTGYYIETFHNYAKEYRLHMTQDDCFMSWRKLRRTEATDRYFFNSTNCNWVSPEHELFARPTNWDAIVEACKLAMIATGLDIGCFDVRVQSERNSNPSFILIECNSAPALGEAGIAAYREQLALIINNKINTLNNQ